MEPRRDQGFTRRKAIRSGAVAAGFVWATPAVRSVRLSQAPGSPPPTSSSTTTTELPTVRFGGTLEQMTTVGEAQDGCSSAFGFAGTITAVLDDLGPGEWALSICMFPGVDEVLLQVLAYTLTTASGTVTGNGHGTAGIVDPDAPAPVRLELGISGGTGVFAGAAGSMVLDGLWDSTFDPETLTESGPFTGTVTGFANVAP